ncbi:MAG: hypothetical protein ABJB34_04900 [Acidobacteriota bacterium]
MNDQPKVIMSEIPNPTMPPPPNLETQVKVSKILSRGFVFSIVWLGGAGSLIALISGLQARHLIRNANGEVGGVRMAWWCIISGLVGMVIGPFLIYYY